jgi:hypothetical protein
MYRFRLETLVAAPVERVWRALCDPSEVVRWDSDVIEAVDAPPDYPRPGQSVHWRCRDGSILLDQPQEVAERRRLRSLLRLGRFRYDETYDLAPQAEGTHLAVTLSVTSELPVVGAIDALLIGGPRARAGFAASLAGLKRHCEAES